MGDAIIVGFLAETELHPGAGQGLGTIDQPVQREGGSKFPVIPGSSYKGAAKGEFDPDTNKQYKNIFGDTDAGGTVAFGDIRLLLLPMRCSEGAYIWVTTPLLLERFERDARRAQLPNVTSLALGQPPVPSTINTAAANGQLHIEEFLFKTGLFAQAQAIAPVIGQLLPDDPPYNDVKQRLQGRLAIMNDTDFGWFCEYGLPLRPHNQLNKNTKASENFWYEEYLPSDTLMYAVNTTRNSKPTDLKTYGDELAQKKWLQLGGNETTGEGVCRVHVWKR